MVKKKDSKILTFPLLEEMKHKDTLKLNEEYNYNVPMYIHNNLNNKLRTYQEEAIRYFHYSQEIEMANDRTNQLLFHMATGAGKTMVMASLILYLYKEKNYQNFLFLVNTKGVVEKTKDNLLNSQSPKYLFKESVEIDGERISFVPKKQFPKNPEANVIYIRIDTIQSVSSELNEVRENGLTYEDLAEQPVVILGDEAHHFNAYTRSKLSTEDKKNKNWEHTIDRIRKQNPKNRQLEFTATIDVENDAIYEKYKDKIVYRYGLDMFIEQGYSKKIYRLQANTDDKDKILNAVLLNQYRKYVAKEHNIPNFKPIILFKSSKIAISNATNEHFNKLIDNLSVEFLTSFIQNHKDTNSKSLKEVYSFYEKQNIAKVIVELKYDFQPKNLINVNDTTSSGMLEDKNNFTRLNTLEDPNNPFRVIFAVAKLSEGWDVLNLHDIVRISEQASATPNATNSEAQLIGRGARYNPFQFEGAKSYTRRFDNQNTNLTILESLHYHTVNEPAYLKNLKKSLDTLQLRVEEDSDMILLEAYVKETFKKTKAYQYGQVFFNETEPTPLEIYDSLNAYGIDTETYWLFDVNQTTVEQDLQDYTYTNQSHLDHLVLDKRFFKKVIQRNRFFHFSNLKEYLPNLKSIQEFLTSENWLKKTVIMVRLAEGKKAIDLSTETKLEIVNRYLTYVEEKIKLNFSKQRGTKRFKAYPIKDIVKDYTKITSKDFSGLLGSDFIQQYPMNSKNQSWFIFDRAIVNGLEKEMIDWLEGYIDPLKTKYTNVYLIRIDERNTNLTLHAFKNAVGNYKGFIPDFLMYLEGEDFVYQVFMEPKGEHLLERDQWKEDLLQSLNTEDIELIGENTQIRLYGIKFYIKGDLRNTSKELSDLVFDGVSLNKTYQM